MIEDGDAWGWGLWIRHFRSCASECRFIKSEVDIWVSINPLRYGQLLWLIATGTETLPFRGFRILALFECEREDMGRGCHSFSSSGAGYTDMICSKRFESV